MENGLLNPILTFGKRLENLMKNDGINIMEKGANIELSKRLYEKGALHYSGEDYDTKNKNRDSARKRIEEHRKADSASNVSGYWLKTYCDYFHCSADYLFGYIEMPTHAETDIHAKTGLSSEAIEQLIEWNEKTNLPHNGFYHNSILFISDLLECCGIQAAALAQNVSNYLLYKKISETENLTSKITKGIYDKYEIERVRTSYKFMDCLEYIYKHSKNIQTEESLQTAYPKTADEKYWDDILGV